MASMKNIGRQADARKRTEARKPLMKLRFLAVVFAISVCWMAIQKPLFLLRYSDLAAGCSWGELFGVVWHGLKLDLTVAGYITALPILLTLASVWMQLPERATRLFLNGYFGIVAVATAVIFAVDLELYEHWGFRIDSSLLIYLADPSEAMASVDWWTGIRQTLLCIAWAASMYFSYSRIARLFDSEPLVRRWAAPASLLLLLCAGLDFLAIRGGVGASVANVSKVYFSTNPFLNHAATNPVFSFLSSLGKREDFASEYLFFDESERAERFEAIRGNGPQQQGPAEQVVCKPRPNVVVVIMESFARTLMEADVAGEPVMPHLNRLKREGVWFENFFANSFRTDRGEVAILSGFPAQTKVSIMKMPGKSRNLPSIARSLGQAGYETCFYYGGDLNFTDQSSYMYATGWQRLVWQKDLSFDRPTAKWGYDDEVMCRYFADEVIALSVTGKPFLAGLLTLSSHPPYDVPYRKFEHPMLNATAFTDEQIGRMIDRLKASPAWDNLVIVLVADHGYPYPSTLLYNEPLRHRIPMLWLGGGLCGPREVTAYASQIDLAATLLAQLGIAHDDFDYSKDIFAPAPPRKFAYYAFDDGFGVVDESGAVVFDCVTGQESPNAPSELTDTGRTMLQTTYRDLSRRF